MTQARLKPALRTRQLKPFRVMSVMERAGLLEAQGRDIVHLEVGEPDFVTAAPIAEAGMEALRRGFTGYTPATGLLSLREKISTFYTSSYGVSVDPGRIIVTPGASGALMLLAQMMLDPGDGVLMADPGYPCNRNYVSLAGGQAQLVPVDEADAYKLSTSLLEPFRRSNSRGLWLASPGNPSGATLNRAELQALSDWAAENALHLLVDEIYHGLDYVGGLPTALVCNAQNFVINSFSKYFGMTGWRLGWLVVPPSLVETATILAQNLFIAAPTLAQHAALRAFDADTREILEHRRAEFQCRRDFLAPALQELGFSLPVTADGAFYLYAGIERFSEDSEAFCHMLLEEQGVAVTPGIDFGEHGGRKHVRFAFTTGMERLELGVERLRKALRNL